MTPEDTAEHVQAHPRMRTESVRRYGARMTRLSAEARDAARKARRQLLWVVPAVVVILVVSRNRSDWVSGIEQEVRIVSAILLTALGAVTARDIGRVLEPTLLGRLGPETAATVGFVVRLVAIIVIVLVALRAAGLPPRTLAFGGAAAAVVLGLAAQQTIGNVLSGFVLVSARPFRIGERVRFQAGVLAGRVEATVTGFGLLYVECTDGPNRVLVPNAAVMQCAITPLHDVAGVDFEARLRKGTRPSEVQAAIREYVTVPTQQPPDIDLRGLDDDEVVVAIRATPLDPDEGWLLADQVIAAVSELTDETLTTEHAVVPSGTDGRAAPDDDGDRGRGEQT